MVHWRKPFYHLLQTYEMILGGWFCGVFFEALFFSDTCGIANSVSKSWSWVELFQLSPSYTPFTSPNFNSKIPWKSYHHPNRTPDRLPVPWFFEGISLNFRGVSTLSLRDMTSPTWRIIPVSKWLGSPPFIRHGVRPFGRGPTTRSLVDNDPITMEKKNTYASVLGAHLPSTTQVRWIPRNSAMELVNVQAEKKKHPKFCVPAAPRPLEKTTVIQAGCVRIYETFSVVEK